VEGLKKQRVLLSVRGELLMGNNTTLVAVFCGDGDHSDDKFCHLKRESAGKVHLLPDNGGAIWLDPNFRAPDYSSEEWSGLQRRWRDRITGSVAMKGTNRVALMVHYPCGEVTGNFGMGINDLLASVVRAHWRVKNEVDEFLAGRVERGEAVSSTKIRVPTLFHHPHPTQDRGQTWWVNPEHAMFRHLRP